MDFDILKPKYKATP